MYAGNLTFGYMNMTFWYMIIFYHLCNYYYMVSRRWDEAQEAEKRYWLSEWGEAEKTRQNQRLYWQEILNQGFGLDFNFFLNKDVLEIGCGPSGIIFQIDEARSRIGLEPMDLSNLINEDWKKTIVRRGVGEELPFENNSFDIVISFNALDHAFNPQRVMQEIHRVLRDDGDFLLSIYTLHEKCRLLQGIINRLDPPHPNHFTFREIISKVSDNSFHIEKKRYEKGPGPTNEMIKKLVGSITMNRAWLLAKKV